MLKNGWTENLYPSIYEARASVIGLLEKRAHIASMTYLYCAISAGIAYLNDSEGHQAPMGPMKLQQSAKVCLNKGIAVHYEKISGVSKILSGKLNSTGGAERTEFFRVFDLNIPGMAIAKLLFDLLSKIT